MAGDRHLNITAPHTMRASTKDSILPEVRGFIQENGVNRDFLPGMRCNRPCNTCHVDVAGSGERVRHILGLGITHILLLTYIHSCVQYKVIPTADRFVRNRWQVRPSISRSGT